MARYLSQSDRSLAGARILRYKIIHAQYKIIKVPTPKY